MKISYSEYNLRFRYPFTISKGTKTHQPTFVIMLDHMGHKGYGEAPAISYYHIPISKMIEDLEVKKNFVEMFAFTEPDRYWQYLHHLFPANSFLVCALDIAAWDLFGKMRQKPLNRIWGLDPSLGPLTDYTIGIDNIDEMVSKIKDKPWPIYKIKLGTEKDIEIVQTLRQHTNAVFRVDANAAWSVEEALKKIPILKDLGVEFVEQPLAKDNWVGMKLLLKKTVLPLIADESCVKESDVQNCAHYFHGVNIKLTKCGGITPALRMIEKAKSLGMKVMVGSMNESTIGSAAIGHLLPMLDYVDMDGPLLLAEDIATGIKFDHGKVILSEQPGLGVEYTRRD